MKIDTFKMFRFKVLITSTMIPLHTPSKEEPPFFNELTDCLEGG